MEKHELEFFCQAIKMSNYITKEQIDIVMHNLNKYADGKDSWNHDFITLSYIRGYTDALKKLPKHNKEQIEEFYNIVSRFIHPRILEQSFEDIKLENEPILDDGELINKFSEIMESEDLPEDDLPF